MVALVSLYSFYNALKGHEKLPWLAFKNLARFLLPLRPFLIYQTFSYFVAFSFESFHFGATLVRNLQQITSHLHPHLPFLRQFLHNLLHIVLIFPIVLPS